MTGSAGRTGLLSRGEEVLARNGTVTGPVLLHPRRRPGHLGQVNLGQLLLIECVAVGILALAGLGSVQVIAGAVVAAVLLVLTLSRRQGRWWLERKLMWRRFRRRSQSRPAMDRADPRLGALPWLAPGLAVTDVPVSDSSQVGVARDDAGWYAVAAVQSDRWPPLHTLVDALAEAGQAGAVVQVVVHTVPALHAGVEQTAPASRSYQQLLAGLGVVVPVDRAIWVVVRLDAQLLAESGARQTANLSLAPTMTAGLIRRVCKGLRGAGVVAAPLDADGVIAALRRSCDLDGPVTEAPREEWNQWHSPALTHRSFWLSGWPRVDSASTLVGWLTTAPASLTNVAISLLPQGDTVDLRCLVRVAAPADVLPRACREVVRHAREHHAEVFPLDGEQAVAVYATAPTGGAAR